MSESITPLHGVVPFLAVADGTGAVDFYKRAFGATEIQRMTADDGKRLMYCRLEINGGTIALADDFPEYSGGVSRTPDAARGSPVTLHLQVADCDATFARAVECGATPMMPPADMFWGDRYAQVKDPFGHHWSIGHTLVR